MELSPVFALISRTGPASTTVYSVLKRVKQGSSFRITRTGSGMNTVWKFNDVLLSKDAYTLFIFTMGGTKILSAL
jgi:hypothetical protein